MKLVRVISKWWYALCSALISFLGFGCSTEMVEEYGCPYCYVALYGCPSADYKMEVSVQDENALPVEGAAVLLTEEYDQEYNLMADTLRTDASGQLDTTVNVFPAYHQVYLITQKDGYKADTTLVEVNKIDDSKADGWYEGVFGINAEITLKQESEDPE
ncbi:MAG: radical SAM-associated putative lipoprotein [Paludibacteraceae bacterium]|nr:radical SAM-associated putative lipoprotein [Paludibacteraceae bacterium]